MNRAPTQAAAAVFAAIAADALDLQNLIESLIPHTEGADGAVLAAGAALAARIGAAADRASIECDRGMVAKQITDEWLFGAAVFDALQALGASGVTR